MSLRYSELTPSMLTVLRLDRALAQAYGDLRSTRLLEGYEAWRKKSGSRTPQTITTILKREPADVG